MKDLIQTKFLTEMQHKLLDEQQRLLLLLTKDKNPISHTL